MKTCCRPFNSGVVWRFRISSFGLIIFDVIEVHKGTAPLFDDRVCDLIEHPETAELFILDGY